MDIPLKRDNSGCPVTENLTSKPPPFKPTFNLRPSQKSVPQNFKRKEKKERKVVPSFCGNLVGASQVLRGDIGLKPVPLTPAVSDAEDGLIDVKGSEIQVCLLNAHIHA